MTIVSSRTASVLAGAVRVLLGAFWLHEGWFKLNAGFGRSDILLVADGASSNSRVPGYFAWFADHVLGAAPSVFAVATPLTEVLLGLLLIAGVFTVPAAAGSLFTLCTYWSSDQLIWQYPVMALLSGLVLFSRSHAAAFSVTSLVLPRLKRTPPSATPSPDLFSYQPFSEAE